MTLLELNQLPEPRAREAFLQCCGTRWWAEQMAASRPFRSPEEVHATAGLIFAEMVEGHWMEAFAAHPRIGEGSLSSRPPSAAGAVPEVVDAASRSSVAVAWSKREQAGMAGADAHTRAAMAVENASYEARFGWPYIVCATGRTAEEMLLACVRRQRNPPEKEAGVAADEQRAITALRIDKLLDAV